MKTRITCASYLDTVLRPKGLQETAREIVKMIKESKIQFDSIAFTGMSGTLVAPTVALRLRKNPVVIRKTTESTHSSCLIEAMAEIGDYIIIDDFRSSGRTLTRIIDAMNGIGITPDQCKGVFLYTGGSGVFIYSNVNDGGKEYTIPQFGHYK
jgi:orotate phosphoribosyltransferase